MLLAEESVRYHQLAYDASENNLSNAIVGLTLTSARVVLGTIDNVVTVISLQMSATALKIPLILSKLAITEISYGRLISRSFPAAIRSVQHAPEAIAKAATMLAAAIRREAHVKHHAHSSLEEARTKLQKGLLP